MLDTAIIKQFISLKHGNTCFTYFIKKKARVISYLFNLLVMLHKYKIYQTMDQQFLQSIFNKSYCGYLLALSVLLLNWYFIDHTDL